MKPHTTPQASRPGLPRGVRAAVYLRSLGLQASWNNQRMQNLGLLATLLPWLRSRDRQLDDDRLFCRRYYEFFNTNPYLANYIIGGLLRLEADRAAGDEPSRTLIRTFRDSLARAFASLGDQLFWLGMRPAVVMGGCLLALLGRPGLVMALFGAFACGQLIWRWSALERGYALGFDLVDLLSQPAWHRAVSWAKRSGMTLTGATAGWYLVRAARIDPGSDSTRLVPVLVLGLLLPLACRRRWPGEVLVLAATVLALALAFAI